MMKPYYLIITPFFPTSNSFRGPFVFDQAKAINDLGIYQSVVFKPKAWYSKEKDYEFENIKVYRFRTYDFPSYILPGLFDFLSNYALKRKLKSIGISTDDIKVAHAHVTRQGAFAKYLKNLNSKIISIVQHHGFDVLSLENGLFRKFKWHRLWIINDGAKICNEIDLNVGVSGKTLKYLESFKKVKPKKSYILFNGVDKKKFFPIADSKNADFFTIGCVANFWPLKDQMTLLKALKKVRDEQGIDDIQLKLIGTGETLDLCKSFVLQNNLEKSVEFIDSLPHDQLVYFYNSLNLFVLPSYWEAFGCVYAEAHQCGIPFIGVRNQGIEEIICENDKKDQLINKSDVEYLTVLIVNYYKKKLTYKPLNINMDILETTNEFLNYINTDSNI